MMDDTAWADDMSLGSIIDHHPLLVRPSFEQEFPPAIEYSSSEGILPPRPAISTSSVQQPDQLRGVFPAPANNDDDSMMMVSNRRLEGNTSMDDERIMYDYLF